MKKVTIILMILAVSFVFAQEKEKLSKKLKKIEGKAQSITITTDKGTYTFEKDDADALLNKLKPSKFSFFHSNSPKSIVIGDDDITEISDLIDEDDVHVKILGKNKGKFKVYTTTCDENCSGTEIKVTKKDGKLTITETKDVDGKKEVKTYEGKDAEKYLEENSIDVLNDDDRGDNSVVIWTTGDDSDISKVVKKIKANKKKVKVEVIKEKDDE